MIRVAVAGNFYPLHDGHIEHIIEAYKLGDYLIAIIGTDEYIKLKGKPIYLSLENRIKIIRAFVDEVIVVIDKDGTVTETLRMIKPDIFAKGGDRIPSNMPQNEVEVCKNIGCRIIYGIGRQLHSSSKLVKEVKIKWGIS